MQENSLIKGIQDIMRQDVGVDGDAQRLSQLSWLLFLKILDDQDQELEVLEKKFSNTLDVNYRWRNWAGNREGLTGEKLINFINSELFPYLKSLKKSKHNFDRSILVKEVFKDSYNYMKSGQLLRQVINKINSINFNSLNERKHFGVIYERLLNSLQSAGNAGEFYTPRAITKFISYMLDPKPNEKILDPACGTGGMITCCIDTMRENHIKTAEDEKKMQNNLIGFEKKPFPFILCVTNMLLKNILSPNFIKYDNTLTRPYISWTKEERVDVVVSNPPFAGKEEPGVESNFPNQFRTRETADLFLSLIIRLLKKNGRAGVIMPDGTMFGDNKVKTFLKKHLLEETNLHTIIKLHESVFKPYANKQTFILFFDKGSKTKDIWYHEIPLPNGMKSYSMTSPIEFEHFRDCINWWGGKKRKGRNSSKNSWKVNIQSIIDNNYNLDIKNPFIENKQRINIINEIKKQKVITKNLNKSIENLYSILGIKKYLQDKSIFSEILIQDQNLNKMKDLIFKSAINSQELTITNDDSYEIIKKINKFKKENDKKGLHLGEKNNEGLPKNWAWVPALYPSNQNVEIKEAVFKRDILKEGKYPVIDQGKVFIRGFSNDSEKLIKCNSRKPLILFGDHTRELKLIDFDFIIGADGVKIIEPLIIDPHYYFIALNWLNIDSRGYGRHFKILRSSIIPLPPLKHQHEIVQIVKDANLILKEILEHKKGYDQSNFDIFSGLEQNISN